MPRLMLIGRRENDKGITSDIRIEMLFISLIREKWEDVTCNINVIIEWSGNQHVNHNIEWAICFFIFVVNHKALASITPLLSLLLSFPSPSTSQRAANTFGAQVSELSFADEK